MKRSDFDIEFVHLKTGSHRFSFAVEPGFFREHENSLIGECRGKADVLLEKVNENLFLLEFDISGIMNIECGRCLDRFDYPFSGHYRMEMKISDSEKSDDEDLIIVRQDEKKINVSEYIYEFFGLQFPIKATCDMAGKECDSEMLKKLKFYGKDVDNIEENIDPRWDSLKKLKKS